MCRQSHKEIFYAFHGPGPYECLYCHEDVLPWWATKSLGSDSKSLVVHHVDHNHSNDDPFNLGPMHYGCHTRYHHESNPLVARGSTLPDEWRKRIQAAVSRRFAEMNDEVRADFGARVRQGIHEKRDTSPLECDQCNGGPFRGQHGLRIHVARFHGGAARKALGKVDRSELKCACGAGPFRGPSALRTHVSVMHADVSVRCECGAGPFANKMKLGWHRRKEGCCVAA